MVLGIADHDTRRIGRGRAVGEPLGITWSRIELNTDVTDCEVHVLGYYLDRRLDWLQEQLRELRDAALRPRESGWSTSWVTWASRLLRPG